MTPSRPRWRPARTSRRCCTASRSARATRSSSPPAASTRSGAGCLIVEIQQNSDTTYRVFDFNRPGLDGQPRELHIPQSLASIDFDDVEPSVRPPGDGVVEANAFFAVTRLTLSDEPLDVANPGECALVAVLRGEARCGSESFAPGAFFLVPADAAGALPVSGPCEVLVTELP